MHGQTCAILVPYYQPTLPTGSTVVVIKKKKKKALRGFEQFSFFPHLHQKEINQ